MRKSTPCYLFFLATFSLSTGAFAQTQLTGTVKSTANEPLIGVNVVVKGTSVGTATDVDGAFRIQAPEMLPRWWSPALDSPPRKSPLVSKPISVSFWPTMQKRWKRRRWQGRMEIPLNLWSLVLRERSQRTQRNTKDTTLWEKFFVSSCFVVFFVSFSAYVANKVERK